MRDEASIIRQLHRELNFTPPYCPRAKCPNHFPHMAKEGFSVVHGKNSLKRFPYCAIRFRCRDCDKTFSASFFKLHYRQKVWGLNSEIDSLENLGASKRAIARHIHHSERLVRDRQLKMARWGLLLHASLTEELKVSEAIVYDGLENFSFSQYDPNNINHAVGKKSLFTYDFNFCPLNRKGAMTAFQKSRKALLEKKYGHYPRDAIRTATKRIFERLVSRAGELTVYSDRHFQYRRVVEEDLPDKKITHLRVSSKIHRNFKNPLFAVNNIDLMARQDVSSFKRETISFNKHSIAMQESFVRYVLRRNYRRPKFWGTHRSDPKCSRTSPAMELGLTDRIMRFDAFFRERVLPTHVRLHEDWLNLYLRLDPYSRRPIAS